MSSESCMQHTPLQRNSQNSKKRKRNTDEKTETLLNNRRRTEAPSVRREAQSADERPVETHTVSTGELGECAICNETTTVFRCGGTCKNDDTRQCLVCTVSNDTFDKDGQVKCPYCRQYYTPPWVNDDILSRHNMNVLSQGQDEPHETIFTAIRKHEDEAVRQWLSQDPELLSYQPETNGCSVSDYIAQHGSEQLQMDVFSNVEP